MINPGTFKFTDKKMNGGKISKLMGLNPTTKFTFKGVYSADNVPALPDSLPASYVINTDPADLPGKHWTAVYIPRWGPGEYFDTRGIKPQSKDSLNLLGHSYIYNTKMLQFPLSSTCGQHCMNFIYERGKGNSFLNILKQYHFQDLLKNDIMINQKIEHIFQTDEEVFDLSFLNNQISRELKLSL